MGGVCFISKGWRDTKQRELGIRWGRARTLRFPVAPRKYCGFLRYVRERKLVAAWPHCPLKRQADRHFRKYVSAPTGNTLARANFPAKSCHVSYICTYIYVAPINLYFSPFSLSLSLEVKSLAVVANDIGYGCNDGFPPSLGQGLPLARWLTVSIFIPSS